MLSLWLTGVGTIISGGRHLSAFCFHYIEAVRKWVHLLAWQHFTLITNWHSVAFMLGNWKKTRLRIARSRRGELSAFNYSIRYWPGKENVSTDVSTRVFCASVLSTLNTFLLLKICLLCRVCTEFKCSHFHYYNGTLIKTTQPMEYLSNNFIDPLSSASCNNYILLVVDKYS